MSISSGGDTPWHSKILKQCCKLSEYWKYLIIHSGLNSYHQEGPATSKKNLQVWQWDRSKLFFFRRKPSMCCSNLLQARLSSVHSINWWTWRDTKNSFIPKPDSPIMPLAQMFCSHLVREISFLQLNVNHSRVQCTDLVITGRPQMGIFAAVDKINVCNTHVEY